MSLYEGSMMRVRICEGHTDPIPMLSGVRQGCLLSPILFNLVIDFLVHGPGDSGVGFEIACERIAALVYADDVAFVAATPSSMGDFLNAAEETAKSSGGLLQSSQVCTLHFRWRGESIPTTFQMAGQHRHGARGFLPPPWSPHGDLH